ncbi:MAG: CRTAC1 family protein [Acidobacteriota bacterium]
MTRLLTRSPAASLLAIAWICLATATTPANGQVFEDATTAAGLSFEHFNGMTGELYFPEIAGSGAALLDYDGDGDLDLYLVQGSFLDPAKKAEDALLQPPAKGGDRLFRNDLGKDGKVRFRDVTATAGLRADGYGMGVAAGDYDNDGHVDLYVANYGSNQLWRNRGDGTFEDVTAKSGTDDERWSVAATFSDYDGDGRLDLFILNYVQFDRANKVRCYESSSRRDYCGPSSFPPEPDRLLRNRGDGTFEDVSLKSGIGRQKGAGLGVLAADFNGDRRTDFYVANDGMLNFLWINRGDGTFQEDGLFTGTAVNRNGKAEASMGVDAADFDGDGDLDLFMTHLAGETNTLYINDGSALFEDRTLDRALAESSLPFTSFGTAWLDYDHDGRLDLVVVNGAVTFDDRRSTPADPYPLGQSNQLFRQLADGRFAEVGKAAGAAFALSEVSRGLACGDLDNDGDQDLVQINNSGPARLLLNRAGSTARWIGFEVRDGTGHALGARVELRDKAGKSRWSRVRRDGSYASSHDPRVVFGLGDGFAVAAVRVHWPDGEVETWPAPENGRYTRLIRGAAPSEEKKP